MVVPITYPLFDSASSQPFYDLCIGYFEKFGGNRGIH